MVRHESVIVLAHAGFNRLAIRSVFEPTPGFVYSIRRALLFPLAVFLLMAGAFIAGCDSQEQQDEFVQDASSTPDGFARTDNTGRILDDDENDWRVSPIYGGKVRFDPAYPNPVAGEFVTIPVTILEFNSIQGGLTLRARDASGSLRTLDDILDASDPGAYVFRFSPTLLNRTGLVRIFIFDRLGELVSYGDLMIE
jgi:hypothetical protein